MEVNAIAVGVEPVDVDVASSLPSATLDTKTGESDMGKVKRSLSFLEIANRGGLTYCQIPSCGVKCDEFTFASASALAYYGIQDKLAILKICKGCQEKADLFEKESVEAVRNSGNMFNILYEPQSHLPETVNLEEDDLPEVHTTDVRRNGEIVEVDFDRSDVETLVKEIMLKYNVKDQVQKCVNKCAVETLDLEKEFEDLNKTITSVDAILYDTYKKYNSVFDRRPQPIVTQEMEINADGSIRKKNMTDEVICNSESLKKLPALLERVSEMKRENEAKMDERVDADLNQSIICLPDGTPRKPGPASKTAYYEHMDALQISPFARKAERPDEFHEKSAEKLLPTPRIIPRAQPREGDVVYVAYKSFLNFWVKGEILERIENEVTKQKEFVVHYEPLRRKDDKPTGGIEGEGTRRIIRQLTLKQMAYNLPCPFVLPVGSRVIAKYKDEADSICNGQYYAGIVAEPPKKSSKHRYLIFFDDGYAQYVFPDDVLLVCESSQHVWNDVYPDGHDFIKDYIDKWPQWPMVKLHVGSMVATEWNGKWMLSRIVEVDNCLARARFEWDGREEWIYRGSTRFRPVYKILERQAEMKRREQEGNYKENRIPHQELDVYNMNRKGPLVEYKNEEVASKELVQKGARKSTAPREYYEELKEYTSGSAKFINMLDPDLCVEFQGALTKISIPADAPKPKDFVPHQCDSSCVIEFVPSKELSRLSPLAIPFFFGWAREVSRAPRHTVFYRTPCGIRLRHSDELANYLQATDSNLSIDHFSFDYDIDCLSEFVPYRSLVSIRDISYGKEAAPIQCINSVDYDPLPYMEYTAKRIVGENVPLNLDEDFLVCCDCTDNCQDKSKCACWKLTMEGVSFTKLSEVDGKPYVGYEHRRLKDHIVSGIYECNSKCKCKQTCSNRVVQNGVQWPLQIFKTSKKGWGIRAVYDMPEGTFISIYSGQILTDQTANEDGMEKGDEYLAELDFIEISEQVKEGYESDVTDIEKESSSDSEGEKEEKQKKKVKLASGEGMEGDAGEQGDKEDSESERDTSKTPTRKIPLRRTGGQKSKMNINSILNSSNVDGDDDDDDDDDGEIKTDRIAHFYPKVNSRRRKRKHRRHRDLYGDEEQAYIMDAKSKGNIGRYLNHSCAPNVFVQNVFVDSHDLRFPQVAFFTNSHVKAGTELTWDYNYSIGSVPGKELLCYCMTPYCRGRLL